MVIVGTGAHEDDVDISVSSDESDGEEDEAHETTPVGWDYISADMNIPSLPINEGEGIVVRDQVECDEIR